jgi:imidazolonepropionase-like amidohydrolase
MTGCRSHRGAPPSAITNARLFDGARVIDADRIVMAEGKITSIGGAIPAVACVTDARGATLMPGLIDSHTHTDVKGLRTALTFGVTTELDMNGRWSGRDRRKVAGEDRMADVRAPGMGLTPPGGHPTEYQAESRNPFIRLFRFPTVSTPEDAAATVARRVAEGADYIKIFLEDGEIPGHPGLTVMDDATLRAAVEAAHAFGKLAIVHAVTRETTRRAVAAGADGLAHLFLDRPHTPELIAAIAETGAFVVPCLVLNASVIGNTAADLAADPRVAAKLDRIWISALNRSFNTYPQGRLEDMFATLRALRAAGVDILAGTDVSDPLPEFGGLAHGASLHHELQLLVASGMTPTEALTAATATPARRFGLTDRGWIAEGARADLVLVDGDPTVRISDTLSIRAVWRRGVKLPL